MLVLLTNSFRGCRFRYFVSDIGSGSGVLHTSSRESMRKRMVDLLSDGAWRILDFGFWIREENVQLASD